MQSGASDKAAGWIADGILKCKENLQILLEKYRRLMEGKTAMDISLYGMSWSSGA